MPLELTGYVGKKHCSWTLSDAETHIGRRTDLQISLPDQSVSRVHAIVRKDGETLYLEDLGSHNGTYVNGSRVQTKPCSLRPGDRIGIGRFTLRVEDPRGAGKWSDSDPKSLGNTWSYPAADLESRSKLFRVLNDLGGFLVAAHTQEEIYVECLRVIHELFTFQMACFVRVDESGNPVIEATRSMDPETDGEPLISRTLIQRAQTERQPLLVHDQMGSSVPVPESGKLVGLHSMLVVPLCDGDEVIGILYLVARPPTPPFSRKHLRRLTLLGNILAVKIINARLAVVRDELQTASCTQIALLHQESAFPAGYEAYTRLVPSRTVAGDLYEVLELPDGRYLYALGDVVGKGVGAALVMASVLAAIRSLAYAVEDPRELSERLHEQMCSCLGDTSFVTLFLGVLDPKAHQLHYVSAGHEEPALVHPDGTLVRLAPTAPPLGMPLGLPFESATIELQPGSVLFVWSDGFTEAYREFEEPLDFWGVERLLKLFTTVAAQPLHAIADAIYTEVDAFLRGAHAPDDRTLLLLRRK